MGIDLAAVGRRHYSARQSGKSQQVENSQTRSGAGTLVGLWGDCKQAEQNDDKMGKHGKARAGEGTWAWGCLLSTVLVAACFPVEFEINQAGFAILRFARRACCAPR